MKNNLRFFILISVLLLLVGGFFLFQFFPFDLSFNSADRSSPIDAKVEKVVKGDRTIPVSIYVADYEVTQSGIPSIGTLLPYEEVNLASEISGKVDCINFEEGAVVHEGALLVKINDDDLQAQLIRARAQQKQIKDKLERSKILFDRNAISRETLEQNEADFQMIAADIQLLRVKIDRTEIKAPFSGTIGFRNVALGTYLQPGTLIGRLVDDSRLRLEFSIPEKYSNLVRKGLPIDFKTVDQSGYHKASVYAIDPKVDVSTRTIGIRALFLNSRRRLKAGMSASVNLGQQQSQSLQIPTQAIVPENTSMKVWVVRSGRAVSVPVVLGKRGENRIEVREGLVKGDSVIITGLLQIKEGSKLLINT